MIRSIPLWWQPSPKFWWVGFRIASFEACSAFTYVTACILAKSLYMTLYIGVFSRFVASTPAPIATGWSDSCRAGFAPAERPCLCTAHRKLALSSCSCRRTRQISTPSKTTLPLSRKTENTIKRCLSMRSSMRISNYGLSYMCGNQNLTQPGGRPSTIFLSQTQVLLSSPSETSPPHPFLG